MYTLEAQEIYTEPVTDYDICKSRGRGCIWQGVWGKILSELLQAGKMNSPQELYIRPEYIRIFNSWTAKKKWWNLLWNYFTRWGWGGGLGVTGLSMPTLWPSVREALLLHHRFCSGGVYSYQATIEASAFIQHTCWKRNPPKYSLWCNITSPGWCE